MRYFIGAILIMAVAGAFVAPPYSYTHEEQALLKPDKRERSMWNYVAWPMRAYENWQNCGTIRYCRATRCAALAGGCTPAPKVSPWERSLKAPTRNEGETATVWRSRVDAWCKSTKSAYERWVSERKSAEAAAKCKSPQRRLPDNSLSLNGESPQGASKPAPSQNSTVVRIDTSNLVDCSILGSRPVQIDEYEGYCR